MRLAPCSGSREAARHSSGAESASWPSCPVSATAKTGKPFDFEVAAPAPLAAASAAGGRGRLAADLDRPALQPRRHALARARRARDRGARAPQPRPAGAAGSSSTPTPTTTRTPARASALAGSSDPLWVGSADAVQYRLSRRVAGLRLHFVNVGRYARPRLRAAQEPGARLRQPLRVGREQCPPREKPLYGSVKAVHVHHTVSLNDYTPAEGAGDRARDLPLPPQLQRLERHRLQRARRQVRRALRGPRRRARPRRRRRPGAGLQLGDRRDRQHRATTRPSSPRPRRSTRSRATSAGSSRCTPSRSTGNVTLTQRRRSRQPLPAPARRVTRPARDRPPRHRPHRLPGRPALRPARRAARDGGDRCGRRPRLHGAPERGARRLLDRLRRDRAGDAASCRGPTGCRSRAAPVEVQTNGDGRWRPARQPDTAADGTFAGRPAPAQADLRAAALPGRGGPARRALDAAAAAPAAR